MQGKKRSLVKRFQHRLPWSLLIVLLCAGSVQAKDLEITDARLRLLPGDTPAAGYFSLHNASDETVALVGARSAAFEKVMMHLSSSEGGMASMKPVSRLELGPRESIEFAPKGYHLMFMQKRQDLAVGDEATVELEFENQEALPVTFQVVSPASM